MPLEQIVSGKCILFSHDHNVCNIPVVVSFFFCLHRPIANYLPNSNKCNKMNDSGKGEWNEMHTCARRQRRIHDRTHEVNCGVACRCVGGGGVADGASKLKQVVGNLRISVVAAACALCHLQSTHALSYAAPLNSWWCNKCCINLVTAQIIYFT